MMVMSTEDYLKKGLNFYHNGDYIQAEDNICRALHLSPGNADALCLLGLVRLENGKVEDAVKLIGSAILINPSQWIYHLKLGSILLSLGRLDDAVALFRRATSLHGDFSKQCIDDHLLPYLERRPSAKNTADAGYPFSCFSYPKCGSHLLSDIIQHMTGLSFHWPETTRFSLDILQRVPERTFLTGHFASEEACFDFLKNNGYKIIVNYRDPRDQLVSFYYFYTEIEKKGDNEWGRLLRRFNKEQAIDVLITTFLAGGIATPLRMASWINGWLEFAEKGIPVLFMSFENLVYNKHDSISCIADFLGLDAPGGRVEEIILATSFDKDSKTIMKKGKTGADIKRKGIAGDWCNHFTQSNRDTFNSVAGRFLLQLGYELC